MMTRHIIVILFITVTAIIQGVSCDERQKRALLKSKKVSKETKISKLSKSKVKRDVVQPDDDGDDLTFEITSTNVVQPDDDGDDLAFGIASTRECYSNSDCEGRGDDRSNGCFLGKCRMCVPRNRRDFAADCYCAKDGGGDGEFDIYLQPSTKVVYGISSWPPFGGQYYDRCNECRQRLEDDGVIQAGAARCNRDGYNIQLSRVNMIHLWKDFGPPNNYIDAIGRNPKDCNAIEHNCELRCGKHNGNQMYIEYGPTYSKTGVTVDSRRVYGKYNNMVLMGFI